MEEEDGGAEAEPEGEAETEETKAEGMPDEGTGGLGWCFKMSVIQVLSSSCACDFRLGWGCRSPFSGR